MLSKLLIVGVGGFVGAIARYLISAGVARRFPGSFPFGTLAVNVIGALIIGVLMAVVADRPILGEKSRLLLVTGILGALTTFSTFSLETFELMERGQWRFAFYNILANVILCVAGVALTRSIARLALR